MCSPLALAAFNIGLLGEGRCKESRVPGVRPKVAASFRPCLVFLTVLSAGGHRPPPPGPHLHAQKFFRKTLMDVDGGMAGRWDAPLSVHRPN